MITANYEYKGYVYQPFEDVEPEENVKIMHWVSTPYGKEVHFDWSPYDTPTEEDFKLWIDLGMPGRISGGTLNRKDLNTILDGMHSNEVVEEEVNDFI